MKIIYLVENSEGTRDCAYEDEWRAEHRVAEIQQYRPDEEWFYTIICLLDVGDDD